MKLSPRIAALVLARLSPTLKSLQEALRGWLPQRALVLVPIPIRVDRRTGVPAGPRPFRGG